ncbi:MAG: lactonase family protein [Candidatus Pristimantibacillus sp.]
MSSHAVVKPYSGIVYIGSYGSVADTTIRVCSFNGETGELAIIQELSNSENASYLTVHPSGEQLYAVSETDLTDGKTGGSVASFKIDKETGKLSVLNRQLTHGAHPCYISTDVEGKALFAANYTGGNAALLPIAEDGSLEEASAIVREEASLGSRTDRQDASHAHAIVPNGSTPYVYVTDLGTDLINCYKVEGDEGLLYQGSTKLHAGAGPRHLTFHPELPYAYAVNELDSTVTALKVSEKNGELTPIQTINSLPADYTGANDAADIHLAASGKFLYSSNRGSDSIAVFAVNPSNGELTLIQNESCGGESPRNFNFTPDGQHILVANQKSNSITLLSVDQETGLILVQGKLLEVASPVCVCFSPNTAHGRNV